MDGPTVYLDTLKYTNSYFTCRQSRCPACDPITIPNDILKLSLTVHICRRISWHFLIAHKRVHLMEDSRVCVIHFCLENVGNKKRKKSQRGRESEIHASSFFMRVWDEATGFKGRLLLLLSSVLERAEINSWVQ
jgi:hypothetical protein